MFNFLHIVISHLLFANRYESDGANFRCGSVILDLCLRSTSVLTSLLWLWLFCRRFRIRHQLTERLVFSKSSRIFSFGTSVNLTSGGQLRRQQPPTKAEALTRATVCLFVLSVRLHRTIALLSLIRESLMCSWVVVEGILIFTLFSTS